MLLLMTLMNIMFSLTFLFLTHPMSMGLILLIQTIIIAFMTGTLSFSYWFSYILFLIMVGGMLILFIYMTSLASNEMFSFSKNILLMMIIMLIIYMMLFKTYNYINMNSMFKNSNLIEMLNNQMFMKNENIKSLNLIYNKPNFMMTIILINYLFLTLIAVVKITNINNGPLRQKF